MRAILLALAISLFVGLAIATNPSPSYGQFGPYGGFTNTGTIEPSYITVDNDMYVGGNANIVGTLTAGGTVPTGKTWAITDTGKLTVAGVKVPEEMILKAVFDSSSTDNSIGDLMLADGAYTIIGVKESHKVAGVANVSPTVDVMVYSDGSTPAAGTSCLSAAMDVSTTANTVKTPTLGASVAVASGKHVGLHFGGTLTSLAGGVVEVLVARA